MAHQTLTFQMIKCVFKIYMILNYIFNSNHLRYEIISIALSNAQSTFFVLEKETLNFFKDVRSCLLSDMKSVSGNDSVLNNLISVLTMWNRVRETVEFVKKLFETMNLDSLCDVLFYEIILSNTKIEDFLEDILQSNLLHEHVTPLMKEQMINMKAYVEKLNSNWTYLKFIILKCHIKYYNAIIPTSKVDVYSSEKVERDENSNDDFLIFRNHIISTERLSLINGIEFSHVDIGLHHAVSSIEAAHNDMIPYYEKKNSLHVRNEPVLNDVKSRVHINVDCFDFDMANKSKVELSDGNKEKQMEYDQHLEADIVISTNELEKIEIDEMLDYFIETDDEDPSGSLSDEYYEETFSQYEEDEEEEFEEYDDISIEEIDDKYMNIYQMHGKNTRNNNNNVQRNNAPKVEETRSVEELLKFIEGDDVDKKSKPKKKKKKKKKKNKNKNTEKIETTPNDNTKKANVEQEANNNNNNKKAEKKETVKNENVNKNGSNEKNINNNRNNNNNNTVKENIQSKEQQSNQIKESKKEQQTQSNQPKSQKKSNNQQQNQAQINKKDKTYENPPPEDLLSYDGNDDEEIESFLKKLQLGGIRESINKTEKKSNLHLENLAQWAREDRRNKFKFLYKKGEENVKNSN